MSGKSQKSEVRSQNVYVGLWLLMLVSMTLSLLAQEELPKLHPPLGEIPPTFWEQHGTTVMVSVPIALLVLAVGIWLLLRPKPIVPVPPEVQARLDLETLLQQPEDGAVISRVTQILRRYVQAAFELPPGEPTTAEFCQTIAGHRKLGTELADALGEFQRRCDERKFAQSSPTTPVGAAARALELVAQGETRRAWLRQQASMESARPAPVSA